MIYFCWTILTQNSLALWNSGFSNACHWELIMYDVSHLTLQVSTLNYECQIHQFDHCMYNNSNLFYTIMGQKTFYKYMFWHYLPKCFLFLWCLPSLDFSKNPLPQKSQTKGFSPVCVLTCLTISLLEENPFPQMSHFNGFSAKCVLWCITRLPLSENPVPQISHLKGFSPVCVLPCPTRLPFRENALPQMLHK